MKFELTNIYNALDLLRQARINLLRHKPFFGQLALSLEFREANFPTYAMVDARGIFYYNPEWIEKLNIAEIETIIAHETLHCAFSHLLRLGDRNQHIYNIAADLVVNKILQANCFMLPQDILNPSDFDIDTKNKIVEEIYDELIEKYSDICPLFSILYSKLNNWYPQSVEDIKQKFDELNDVKDFVCNNTKCPFNKNRKCTIANKYKFHIFAKYSQEEIKKLSKQWTQNLINAYEIAKQYGHEPYGIKRIFETLVYPPQQKWNLILRKYMRQLLPADYTYAFPHKRSHSLRIYLPNIIRHGQRIVAIIDTSGSIDKTELSEFLNEIRHIYKSIRNIDIYIIDCDVDVYQIKHIKSIHDLENLELRGGGGTSFVNSINEAMKLKPDLIIYFTDGYGEFPQTPPDAHVIWVLSNEKVKPPFGKTIKLKINHDRNK